MSQIHEGNTRTFQFAAATAANLRLKDNGSGKLTPADATDVSIGTNDRVVVAADEYSPVRLRTANGTVMMVASGAISAYAAVYGADDGKIASSGTVYEGIALEAATTDGDIIEVLPLPNVDVSQTITGTNAASFTVDADLADPKLAISGDASGSGDFTITLKPEAALSADATVRVPEADGDTLVAVALAQTLTNKTLTAPVIQVIAMTGTTGSQEIRLTTNLADALSIEDTAGDLIVFDTTTGAQVITITPALTVTGTVTASNKLAVGGAFIPKAITTPVAAAGSTVADAAQLGTATVVHITSDDATKGVKLPAATAASVGNIVFVINDSSTAAELYAESTGTVNGLSADASVVIPASKGLLCLCTAAKTWIAFDMTALATAS